MSEFNDFVNGHGGQCPELPLFHTARLGSFPAIIGSNKLVLTPCAHFGKPLIYLFYGRPAYRPKTGGEQPDADFSLCPVSFIFRPARISANAQSIFPHDTGAARSGLFSPTIPPSAAPDYELQANVLSLRRYVSRIFTSNEKYFLGQPDPDLKNLTLADPVRRFLEMIESAGGTSVDDRRYTAELQIESDIALRDRLLAVVLPTAFLDQEDVRNAIIYEWGALPLTYDTYAGGIPQAYYQTVKQKVLDFYREHQLL